MMHIRSMKGETKGRKIATIPDPPLLYVPLPARFGNKPEPVVSPGDYVKKYQVIGQSREGYAAKVHAPVSGVVEKIGKHIQLDGTEEMTVVIRNDFMESTEEVTSAASLPDDGDILRIIEHAGIVGEGGAQFPTAVKYNRKGKPVHTFIINGAECEPFLTGDYALMQQKTEELLEGIMLADRVLEAKQIVVAFERENKELADLFTPFLQKEKYRKVETRIVPNEYPQGGELQLARTVTGIEMPKGTVPLEKGILMSNVGTVYAIYEAVLRGKPVTERIITVSGKEALHPGNYRIKIGTPVSHIVKECGYSDKDIRLIVGGPMMGQAVNDLSAPLTKGSLGVLFLKKESFKRLNCIWCGYCVDVCPMRLMPMKYEESYRQGKIDRMKKYNLDDCIECAACEYICPSNVPLIESIKEGKVLLKKKNDEPEKNLQSLCSKK